jgi:transcriptional regulator with XRE-family HTH domain
MSRLPSGAKGRRTVLRTVFHSPPGITGKSSRGRTASVFPRRAANMDFQTRTAATCAAKGFRSTKARQLAHPIDVRIGRKIKALRGARNLSQTALADKIGVTFRQVQKYENGLNRVGVSKLQAIAAALSIDVRTFVSDLPQTDIGESNFQASERAAYAASPEGVCLIDAYRALPKHQRRMTLGMITALAECAQLRKRGRLADSD